MRFILVYKYGILQTKTERIDINFCENTTQLLTYLQKRVQQSRKNFIVKFRKGKTKIRIIPEWTLQQYQLKEGTELHIEFIDAKKSTDDQSKYSNRYINNILGFNNESVEQIQEEDKDKEQDSTDSFSVRKYLDSECEKMLKQIQRKNLPGFVNIFEQIPEDVPESALLEIKNRKLDIINELGEKGWGAIHYAIFYQAEDILNQLLDLDVDVNKCTSDGWLPVQLAIDLKQKQTLQKLLEQTDISLNLVTSKGSPLHTAAKLANKEILVMLLDKQVDIHLKDHLGKTALDVCADEECKKMLKKYQQKPEEYNTYVEGNLPLSLTTIVRGKILKAKRPFMSLKERYLVIDPFQGSMIRYENLNDYPKVPKEVTPLNKLQGIKILADSQKSWYMKKEFFYFVIEQPNWETYACKYRHTAQKWVSSLIIAKKFASELQKNSKIIKDIKKNQQVIEDIEFVPAPPEDKKKKIKQKLFVNSILSRQSTISNRSYDNNVHMAINYRDSKNGSKFAHQNQKVQSSPSDTTVEEKKQNRIDIKRKEDEEKTQFLTKSLNDLTENKVNFAAFNIVKILGSGAFGKVFLATHIKTGKQYALKALKKKNLIMQKQLKYAIVEANVLKQANNPFIINLHFAFQTPHYLYLALDYCAGKDLSFHLARQITFTENEARFYTAELLLAIEHLHSKKIIYRDLKPENILLDSQGHVKLADFGLSKQTGQNDKTKSFCGSPAYLSPEMLNQKGVGKQSDLYGIGTVLYQFLIGEPPYFSEDIPTLYRNIKEGKLKFPKGVSEVAKSLILSLLERDPKKRIGYKGIQDIKNHAFFNSIDWQKLEKRELKPPERPQIEDSDASDEETDFINKKNLNFTDFDYDDSTKKINRLMNFSFSREQ